MKRWRRWIIMGVGGLVLLCGLAAGAAALSNIGLPDRSPVIDRLSEADKIRLAEVIHLRTELGDHVWAGWGEADIPIIVYNEAYAFLVGLPAPEPGWTTVPGDETLGGPWEPVPDDLCAGQTYYRLRLPGPDVNPQNFAVRVGDHWVASLATKAWFEISLRRQFEDELPGFVRPVFPYRLAVSLFVGQDEVYIAGVEHESFHAYQGLAAGRKLENAERAQRTNEDRYPWDAPQLEELWQGELDLLADAVERESDAEAAQLAREFLAHREERREILGLSSNLVGYERQREWVEGLAKYAELRIWGVAAEDDSYTPVAGADELGHFDRYNGFDRRRSNEISQIRRSGGDRGDGRFYYSGMAQALLLDRLMPDWQSRALEPGVFLDELLADAVR